MYLGISIALMRVKVYQWITFWDAFRNPSVGKLSANKHIILNFKDIHMKVHNVY